MHGISCWDFMPIPKIAVYRSTFIWCYCCKINWRITWDNKNMLEDHASKFVFYSTVLTDTTNITYITIICLPRNQWRFQHHKRNGLLFPMKGTTKDSYLLNALNSTYVISIWNRTISLALCQMEQQQWWGKKKDL